MAKMVTKTIDDKTYYIVEAPSEEEVIGMWVAAIVVGYMAIRMLGQLKHFVSLF
jgi:hypothetical protein